jgi:catechol 2,3-dioxygenase-like lactoylglutathione lyase family enzyme
MLLHAGLEGDDENTTDEFYVEVLGMVKKDGFVVPAKLGKSLFGVDKEIEVLIYGKENLELEVFVTGRTQKTAYTHLCIDVDDRKAFVEKCKEHGIEPASGMKVDREIIFIKDLSGNLFEIKEKLKK